MRFLAAVSWLIALSCVASIEEGCVEEEDVVRTRAANDFECDESRIAIINIGGASYRAKGCGYTAVYDCYQTRTCTPEPAPPDDSPYDRSH
jgi:hypothetical protein